jgi:hypothetical protein
MIARSLLGIAVVAALAYVGVCALLYAMQRSLMYFPQYTRVDAAVTDFSLERDGVRLRGWVVGRGGRDPILYFGGNAERIELNRDDFTRLFPGRAVYLLAYRGYGASEGSPGETALVDDAVALFDEVRRQHPDQPIAVIGRSLGSGVASVLASRRPVARLALVTPFDSMAAVAQSHYRWLPVRWLLRDRYDSARALRTYTGPILIVRAGRDDVIPAANTDRLIASLPMPPRVIDLGAVDHNGFDIDEAYGPALAEFMR